MTTSDVLSAVDFSGAALACFGLVGLVFRIYAWRVRVADVRRHTNALLDESDPKRRALLESNPPPPLTDQVLKIAVMLYLSGMAMTAVRPVYVASASPRHVVPAANKCVVKDDVNQALKLGPQTALEGDLVSSRWTDGANPFEAGDGM